MLRYILVIVLLFSCSISFSQNSDVRYERQGDLIQASYFDDQGNIQQQGTFNLEGELHGKWISFDLNGNKLVEAKYKKGKKVGKWTYYNIDVIKEVIYKDSKIVSVNEVPVDSRLATRN